MTSMFVERLNAIEGSLPALDDGEMRVSYADLRCALNDERRWLQSMNVRCCGLLAENSARWIIADLALMDRGAVNVPLPAYFTRSQVDHVLADAAIDAILTDDIERVTRDHPAFERAATSTSTGLHLFRDPRRHRDGAAAPAGISKVTYTSGSTGSPKGVCLSEQTMMSVTESIVSATSALGVERHLCLLPLPTLLENIAGVYAPLLMGAQVSVPSSRDIGMSYGGLQIPRLLRAIERASPQSLILVPELLRVLLLAIQSGWRAPASLKFIAVGGGAVSGQLLQQAEQARLPVFQGYGLSECASVVCLNTPAHNRPGSVGRPLPHVRLRIDASGEICVGGATMSGYLGEPGHTAAEIRTGDLGEIDADGFVYVRGRAKNMFITGMGRNVTPEWVEGELTAEPAIARALVLGEAKAHPTALLMASPGADSRSIELAVVRANSRLPDYARVRRWSLFAEAPTLANGLLTANGRLRRAEILARYHDLIESFYEHTVDDSYAVS